MNFGLEYKKSQFIVDLINAGEAMEKRTKALQNKEHTVHSKHVGYLFGGKVTIIVTYDDEPRMTNKEWEQLHKEKK